MNGFDGWESQHIGRSFNGTRLEDACPCVKEPCGLVAQGSADPSCTEHPVRRAKTIRQAHPAAKCPGGAGRVGVLPDAETLDRVATAVHHTLLDASLRVVVKTGGGSDWGEFGSYDDQLLAMVRELMRVGLIPVPSDEVYRAATTPDASDRWETTDMPGGSLGCRVCATCGTPTESEPCPDHQPRAYARIGAES